MPPLEQRSERRPPTAAADLAVDGYTILRETAVDVLSSQLLERANRVSQALVLSVPDLLGVCLYGSVARGTATEASDIDILVVARDTDLTPSDVVCRLPTSLRAGPLSLACHTPDSLDRYLQRWSRFAAHLRREGRVLFERDATLTSRLEREAPISTREELRAQRRHLRNYEHPERFGNRFLFPLATLYRIGRATTFVILAERDILTFDADQAFNDLCDLHPNRVEDVNRIRRLKPFYDLVTRRGAAAKLPFEPIDCADELVQARQAIERLIALTRRRDDLAA